MNARKIRKDYRFSPETVARIELVGQAKGGLTDTRVIENAVEQYALSVLGRRTADLVAVKLRGRERKKPVD